MIVEAQVTIKAPRAAVWDAMTNIENSAEIISGIEKIEMVERPAKGLVGLKWRETRMLFGEPATVEKWVTEAKENAFFSTRAEDGGYVFVTTNRISEGSDGITLTGIHETQPQGLGARLKSLPMVFLKGVIRKAIEKDLNDIKAAAERSAPGP
jgi:carbon monoxide dehydrogenase subunit G